MATLGERVATLEADFRNMREDMHELRAMIGDKSQPESVRGRLHSMEGLLRSAVMKRAPGALLRRWERLLIVATSMTVAVCAVIGAVHALTG